MTGPRRAFRFPGRRANEIAAEIDEEIGFHLDMRAAELERAGLAPGEARRQAQAEFGDVGAARRKLLASDARQERRRAAREHLSEWGRDIGFGARSLWRQPAFSAAIVLTLALGIAATTIVFTLADHVLLRPLPYPAQDRIVTVWETNRTTGETRRGVSPGNFIDWAAGTRSFATIGLAEPRGFDLTGDGPPQAVPAWGVSEGFLEALGVRPIVGRGFGPQDFVPGAGPVVLLSHRLWQTRYAGDPDVAGRTISLDYAPATIVGVLPPGIAYPDERDLWAPRPLQARDQGDRRSAFMFAVGRLRPGATAATAQAELERIAAVLASDHPATNAALGVNVVPLEEAVVGGYRRGLVLLLGAGAFLLLTACANVASLLLARGVARRRELGVRAALGAKRSRIFRQLFTEVLLLAGAACLLGVVFAHVGVRILVGLGPAEIPRLQDAALDPRALAFCVVVSLASALLFGAGPAWRLASEAPSTLLGGGGRGASPGGEHRRTRDALVMTEIALAVTLLFGTGLLVRSLSELLRMEPGFEAQRRVSLQAFLWDRNPAPEQRRSRVDAVLARFRSTPGVEAAAVVTALPFHPHQIAAASEMSVAGQTARTGEEARVFTTAASPGYFSVMGIPLRGGRAFAETDHADAPAVAIVNETLARRFFGGQDPVGQQVTVGVMGPPALRRIVGVVRDTRPTTLDGDPRPELFIPYVQSSSGSVTFVARTRSDPAGMIPTLRRQIWEVDPLQTIYHEGTLEQMVRGTVADRWFHLALLGAFSTAALLLAASGIGALISYTTSQRRREIGVRLALGAEPHRLVRSIAGEGLRLAAGGLALGAAAGLALASLLRSMLFGVAPYDPYVLLAITVILGAVAWIGSYLPARAAARVSPMAAVRAE